MSELTEEEQERVIVESDGAAIVQTRTFVKRGDDIVTELPWKERRIAPDDDLAGESARVTGIVKAGRKAA